VAGDIRIPSIPDVPVHLTEHDIYTILEPLKRIIDIRQGKFEVNQRWATYQDLIDFGTLTESTVEQPIVVIPPTSQFDFILSGDIVGGPTTLADGTDPITMPTIINLPNVVCIDGGDAAETFPPSTEGPYGVLGGGSDLVVQDTGVSLSIAATLLNFVGFTVTEPVANQITITASPAGASSEYCPGYTFTFVDTDTFDILGVNVVNLFSVGRRIRFSIGGVDIFGEITTSTFTSNTRIDLTMEGGATLANVAYTVCMMTGEAGWSPIATDPFGGTGINWITSGLIGATFYIVAVGDGGKLATSTDAGVTWTIRTTSTTEHLLQVDYNEIAEIFIAVGNAGTNLRSTNGTTWTAGGNIMGLVTTGTGHVYGIMHHSPTDEWVIIFNAQTGALDHTARSDTDGATWTLVGAGAAANLHTRVSGFTPQNVLAGVDQGCVIGFQDDLYRLDQPADTAFASIILTTQGGTVSACLIYSGINDRYIIGLSTGNITGSIVGVDDVTFGASQLNGFAYSSLHDRAVAVAADGKIGYIADADIATVDSWTLVNNGFNPLTDVQCVHWDSIDGVFIAGAANGQICRSTNGIS